MDIKAGDKVIATITAADHDSAECDEGVWVELMADDGTRPTLCLVKSEPNGPFKGSWYLGVYRNAKRPGIACDLAISFTDDGPVLQAVKKDKVATANLFDLIEKIG